MTIYQTDDDIPNRMSIPLPFVIMRDNVTEERFITLNKQDRLNARWLYGLFVVAQLFALSLGLSLGYSISDAIWFWLLLIIGCVVILIFDNLQDKKKLQIIKNLPKTVPFITINHQNVCVYDVFGKELVSVPIDEIVGLYVIGVVGHCISVIKNHGDMIFLMRLVLMNWERFIILTIKIKNTPPKALRDMFG